ncbi:hypothetical protein [Brevibacterium sp.]|uniref:hypothetical protein n=1 Tax=Brevibacterium sp. TaxID=1701 RepID=UPI0026476000|nr:hypothetical protein [Brevibacterium sp.]MDN6603368.1 hypothetical protein [Brevibacterium sp.]
MSTAITSARPPTAAAKSAAPSASGRIVERTTTITREIFLDDPIPAQSDTTPPARPDAEPSGQATPAPSRSDTHLRGVDRALVRIGVWLIELGRRHSLRSTRSAASRPAASADEIARRVDAAKAHDLRHFISLPH